MCCASSMTRAQSPEPTKWKAGHGTCPCNLSAGEAEIGGSPGG